MEIIAALENLGLRGNRNVVKQCSGGGGGGEERGGGGNGRRVRFPVDVNRIVSATATQKLKPSVLANFPVRTATNMGWASEGGRSEGEEGRSPPPARTAGRKLASSTEEGVELLAPACAALASKIANEERANAFEDPVTSLTRSNAVLDSTPRSHSTGRRPPVVPAKESVGALAAVTETSGVKRRVISRKVSRDTDTRELKTRTSASPTSEGRLMPRASALDLANAAMLVKKETTGTTERGGRGGAAAERFGGGGAPLWNHRGPTRPVRLLRQCASLRRKPSPSRFLLLLPLLPSLLLLTGGPSCVRASLTLIDDNGGCEQGWFPCGHTNATHCVPRRLICNKEIDCPNGEDEDKKECQDKAGDAIQPPNKTKPSIDTRLLCTLGEIPVECVCRIKTRLYCSNAGLSRVPDDISPEVTHLILINNSITLERNSLIGYHKLKVLHLENNGIEDFPNEDLLIPASLRRLFMNRNRLKKLDLGALWQLRNLTHLFLNNNLFMDLDHLLGNLPNLVELFIDYNQITLLGRTPPLEDYNISILFLEYNEIEVLEENSLAGFGQLTSLFLGDNRIRHIDQQTFNHTPLLLTLYLNDNRLQSLEFLSPGVLSSLQELNIDANPILVLSLGSFTSLSSLRSLKMRQIEFTSEQLLNISSLDIKVVYFKRFRYCSFLSRIRNCHPKTDGVSSFENLLVQPGLRKAVWVVAFLTISGNLTVIFGRVFSRDDNKVLSVFIRNLAVADLLTGLYLLVVGIIDKSLDRNYNKYAYEWMTSTKCTATGVLAMTSSQVSIFLLTFMSVERWVCITWPLQRRNLSMRETRWILSLIWVMGFSLALAPVFIYHSPQGFYGTNGLCFPLHLDDPWVPGWFYSAIIFAVINQIGVIVILLAYVSMFCNIRLTRAATPLSLGDREFALRFFFIVFTDCVCWTPIIVLRILALAEVHIDPKFYAYVVVVLLPINSALNPFLYTFTTSKFRSQASRLLARSRVCNWTRRRDSDSEATRTSFFRSGTYKWSSNGRSEALALHNSLVHPHHDDTTISEVVKVPASSTNANAATIVNCSSKNDVAFKGEKGSQQEDQHNERQQQQQQQQLESQF